VLRLNREINKQLATAAVKQRFAEMGGEAMPLTPVEFKQLVAAEAKLFGGVVKARRIEPD
jgi:tripartite-type tricarboxylate transporter receptor subunit TctC